MPVCARLCAGHQELQGWEPVLRVRAHMGVHVEVRLGCGKELRCVLVYPSW